MRQDVFPLDADEHERPRERQIESYCLAEALDLRLERLLKEDASNRQAPA